VGHDEKATYFIYIIVLFPTHRRLLSTDAYLVHLTNTDTAFYFILVAG